MISVRSLVRNPTHYTRLVLLLMFATGVGMFGATFSATLDHSYTDRADYAVGADVRAIDLRAVEGGNQTLLDAIDTVPADDVMAVIRVGGSLDAPNLFERIEVVEVDAVDGLEERRKALVVERKPIIFLIDQPSLRNFRAR